MAVTQYIGARYVPLHMGEWDNTQAYEPLSVVQYMGASYTSKQAVPVGAAILDSEYWVLTGNYNAQVEAYRQQVERFDGRITDNATAIADEAQARADADTALGGRIDAEAEARAGADNALGGRIDAEAEALQRNINSEAETRANADNALRDAITNEAEARANADNELAAKFDAELEIAMFDGSGSDNFTATIVSDGNTGILIDTGKASDITAFKNFAADYNVTANNPFAAWVITHYHGDHCGAYQEILDSGLIDKNTKIYVQMSPTSANDQYTGSYEYWRDRIVPAVQAKGFPAPIVPKHGSTEKFGQIECEFWNTNPAFASTYDKVSWANNGTTDRRTTSMNNYSLIVRFECNGSSYVETGDAEGCAQRLNARYMKPCNVARNPHHFANKMGYEEFFDRLNPDYWLISNHFHTPSSSIEEIDVYAYRTSYIFKYLVWNQDDTYIVTNISQNVYFRIKSGAVLDVQGHLVDKDYDPANDEAPHYNLWMITPPGYYNENPYIVLTMTLIQWFDECYRKFNGLMAGATFYAQAYKESSTGIAAAQIAKDIRKFWKPFNESASITIQLYYPGISVQFLARTTPYSQLHLWPVFSNNDATWVNWTFDFPNLVASDQVITGSFGNGDSVASEAWNYMRQASMLECVLDTGARITLIRERGYNASDTSLPNSAFDGVRIASNGLIIYRVNIGAGGTCIVTSTNIADGSVDNTSRKITELRMIR